MSTPAVLDDYLMDLLGDLAAPAPVSGDAPRAVGEAMPAVAEDIVVASDPLAQASDEPAATAPPVETGAPALAPPTTPDAEKAMAPDAIAPAPQPAAPAPPRLAVTPVRPGSEADLITDDEFEALLDQLHGGGAPTAPAAPVASPAVAAPAPVPKPVAAPAPPRAVPPLPIKPYLQAPIDTGERRRATERKTRWLRLRCDHQHYALELLKVQEVVLPATLLPLRGAAHHMLGVMNLRGQVVPVIDMGLYLGRRPVESDANTRVVVLEENGETLGLRVTAVEDVANLTDQQIEPPDNARVGRITNPLFRGVARLNERAVILLDASQLLK